MKKEYEKIDIKEFAKIRIAEVISSKSFDFPSKFQDENEKEKFNYLKRITSQFNLKELKYDEQFQTLISNILTSDSKDEIDIHILMTYLVYLDDVVEMLKSSQEDIIQILRSIAMNLKLEKYLANRLLFRQGYSL